MTDYPGAIWLPNNNFYPDTGEKTHVVIHGTAGGNSAEEIAHFFQVTEGTSNPVGTQYIVDQVGRIVQTVLEKNGAWGNGTTAMNYKGISIEHVKSASDNSSGLTPIQEQTSFELIKNIRTRHNIPIENIIPHSAVIATACPGPYPFDRMRNYLTGGPTMPQTPTQFQQQAADEEWDCQLKNDTQGLAPKGTGIYQQWLANYIQGIFYGPPVGHERNTVDWQGKPTIKQQFLYAHVEWRNGLLGWYPSKGS